LIDLPQWRPNAVMAGTQAAGSSLACDLRNDATRHPLIYMLLNATTFYAYNPILDEWLALASPTLTGTFGAGATAIFHPTQGPRGTLAAGNTTTKVVLSTALPAAVGVNQLANRGDGTGFRIRIIGNSSGGSGKVEERTVVANTGGTTPTIWLDSPLSFTPASTDNYEFLSGRVFLLSAGTLAAGMWKYYDVLTNFFSGNLATTNLPATVSTDSVAIALSEGHTPTTQAPGSGYFGTLVATASAAGTLTGTAGGGDATVAANQFRNFQIRIVQDTGTPTSVGQRRRIASHTAGASPVYTLASNWTVTPSATASFVIENDDDKILLLSSGGALVYNYNITANTWDTTTWAAPAVNGAGSIMEQAFAITPDVGAGVNPGMIYRTRGGASTIDVLDITAGSTGVWSNIIVYGNLSPSFSSGAAGMYDPFTNGGRYIHINLGAQRNYRFDVLNRVLEPETYLRFVPGGALVGQRIAVASFIDGATKISIVYQVTPTQANMFSLIVQT
jgi:hypothetical protein